ncbi:MAG: transglutaminase-like enzyme putative cysteine protease [Akkermansiaceae bacterium]|nr:transglutaminase-like enzyme putative cysteine protease [Akkermansiaceae bacterium]
MLFRVSSNLNYSLQNPATFFFAIKCIETGGQHIQKENLYIDPAQPSDDFTAAVGMNRFTRVRTTHTGNLQVRYQADVETNIQLVDVATLEADEPGQLLPEAVPFLFPSRYCQSDRLRQQAMDLFGHLQGHYAIASAISDWIYEKVSYQSGSTTEQSSAVDTLEQRKGVCRDFAHLGIALCRSMNIPARYISCYSHLLNPPDFHAVFEVFIGGLWYVLDPTRLAPLNGLVRVATGRDAADVSVCTIFGSPQLLGSEVICNSLDAGFTPITRDSLVRANQALALL